MYYIQEDHDKTLMTNERLLLLFRVYVTYIKYIISKDPFVIAFVYASFSLALNYEKLAFVVVK